MPTQNPIKRREWCRAQLLQAKDAWQAHKGKLCKGKGCKRCAAFKKTIKGLEAEERYLALTIGG